MDTTSFMHRSTSGVTIKSLVIALVSIVCALSGWCQTSEISYFEFEQNEDDFKTWNIKTKSGESASITGHMIIPSEHYGRDEYSEKYPNAWINGPVTYIWGINAAISSIYIPNSIKKIADNSFFCPELEAVVIPNSVGYVGWQAFRYCPKLRSVVVSPNNEVNSSFSGCDIKKGAYPIGKRSFVAEIEVQYPTHCIPDSAGCIYDDGARSFYFAPLQCEKCDLPETTESIETKAFAECKRLKHLRIRAKTPPKVAYDAFEGAKIDKISGKDE